MPEDLMDTYCRRICAILRKRLNASVFVNPSPYIEDAIEVKIKRGDLQYKQIIPDMPYIVQHGESSTLIADRIIANYKASIIKEIFG